MQLLDKQVESPDIETSSDGYAQRFSGKIGAWFLKVQEAATLRMLAPYPQARVLDVGGGHGQITKALVDNGYAVTVFGSDEVCSRRVQGLIDQGLCFFQAGDILSLPYPDRSFDVVVSYRLLPHMLQWPRLIAELSRVADRAVIVDYPTVRSINYVAPLLFKFKKQLEGNTRSYTCFKEKELLETFRSFGFQEDGRFPEFFLPMVLHRVLKSPLLSSCLENACRTMGLSGLFGSPIISKLVRVGI